MNLIGNKDYQNEKKSNFITQYQIKLWPMGEIMPKDLYFLKEIYCGMLQLEDKVDYPMYFYGHQPREVLILDEATNIIVKYTKRFSIG